MVDRSIFERVTLDSSVLLGEKSARIIAAADLGFFKGYWSSWIAGEFARVRTEWIARRLMKETHNMAEANRRLAASREAFLKRLYETYPEAGAAIASYLSQRHP
ncbi:MAG: hypothetical protein Q7O66_00095 [Dehalococcoidia bacterium]|nr:hypothetical protein [Dehalococcoidia bacterium]